MIYHTIFIGIAAKRCEPAVAGLRAFAAVAAKQWFSSAASILDMSQSTLRRAVVGSRSRCTPRACLSGKQRVPLTALSELTLL